MADENTKDDQTAAREASLSAPAGSPRRRMLALTAAGCFLNWIPGERAGGGLNDSNYIWFVRGEELCEAWGFSYEQADQAWANFLLRHRGNYPGGDWIKIERAYLDSLENVEHRCAAKPTQQGDENQ